MHYQIVATPKKPVIVGEPKKSYDAIADDDPKEVANVRQNPVGFTGDASL